MSQTSVTSLNWSIVINCSTRNKTLEQVLSIRLEFRLLGDADYLATGTNYCEHLDFWTKLCTVTMHLYLDMMKHKIDTIEVVSIRF